MHFVFSQYEKKATTSAQSTYINTAKESKGKTPTVYNPSIQLVCVLFLIFYPHRNFDSVQMCNNPKRKIKKFTLRNIFYFSEKKFGYLIPSVKFILKFTLQKFLLFFQKKTYCISGRMLIKCKISYIHLYSGIDAE